MMQDFNTSMVGKIVEFFPELQLATVKLHMSEFSATKDRDLDPLANESLIDVPVHFPRCGGFVLTMPIQPEDDCLVFFTQRGIEHWLYENREVYELDSGRPEPAYRQRFDRSSALALVGFNNVEEAVPDFNTTDVELRNIATDGSTTVQKVALREQGDIEVLTTTGGDTASILLSSATGAVTINGVIFNADGSVVMPKTLTVSEAVESPSVKAGGVELTLHTHTIAGSPANALITGVNQNVV